MSSGAGLGKKFEGETYFMRDKLPVLFSQAYRMRIDMTATCSFRLDVRHQGIEIVTPKAIKSQKGFSVLPGPRKK